MSIAIQQHPQIEKEIGHIPDKVTLSNGNMEEDKITSGIKVGKAIEEDQQDAAGGMKKIKLAIGSTPKGAKPTLKSSHTMVLDTIAEEETPMETNTWTPPEAEYFDEEIRELFHNLPMHNEDLM